MLALILRFAIRNPLRHRLRTGLTLAGIIIAVLAFGLISTLVDAFYAGANSASDRRLITRNAISMTFTMPLAYAERIRAIPGVTDVSWENWFGGVYIDQKNFFPQFAIDPQSFFRLVPEFRLPPDQLQAFMRDRRGAVVGRKLAQRYGWKIGDTIPLKGTIYSGNYEFVLRGIYESTRVSTDETQFFMQWDYLNEATKRLFPGHENTVGVYVIGINDARDAALISQRVDAAFSNSLAETLTETEKGFQLSFLSMIGTIVEAIRIVSYIIILIIMAVMANTMAMAARERTREYATLKALGFRPWVAGALVFAESLTLAIVAGGIGVLLTGPVVRGMGALLAQYIPVSGTSSQTMQMQWLAAIVIGLVAALLPARQAMRVKIIEGLRAAG